MEHKGKPMVGQRDFRAYPGERVKDRFGNTVNMRLCEELVEGRWESFYSIRKAKEVQMAIENGAEEELVDVACACPSCGERRVDWLVWIDDEWVECQTCKTVYKPLDVNTQE